MRKAEAEAVAAIAQMLVRESIRRERERQRPAAVAGRVLARTWRSIISGGWD